VCSSDLPGLSRNYSFCLFMCLGDDAGIDDSHGFGGLSGIDDGHDIHDGSGLAGGNDLDAGNDDIHDEHYTTNDTNNTAELSDDDLFQTSPCNSPIHPDQAAVNRITVKVHQLDSSVADKRSVQTTDAVDRNDHIHRCRKQCPLCGDYVIHLPRHMRSKKHKWTGSKAHTVVQQFELRKSYTYFCFQK
jgi:hypothetical protein